MVAFDPLADTLTSALRTLVLGGVVSALCGLPAAALARVRTGSPAWLAFLAGPAVTVHALNLVLCAFLLTWMGVAALLGNAPPVSLGQLAIFIASFLLPNGAGILAWRYVRRRAPADDPPHVVPRERGPRGGL